MKATLTYGLTHTHSVEISSTVPEKGRRWGMGL